METLNEITVHYRNKSAKAEKITCSQDASSVLRRIYQSANCAMDLKEYFFILLLNRGNKVIGYHKLSEGGMSGTVADIKLAFATALKCACHAMILCHNHPSGTLEPSQTDKLLTDKFVSAGRLLEIKVLDHIILTNLGYYSFSDQGNCNMGR